MHNNKETVHRLAISVLLLAGRPLLFGADPPVIRRQGVVNAASQRPPAAGGAIATGSLISIHGVRFASDPKANIVQLKTPKGALDLPVLHASPQRLDAWIPPTASPGVAGLSVRAYGQESSPESVNLLRAAFGLFSANEKGWGLARAENVSAAGVRSVNDLDRPASPGGRVTVFATGLRAGEVPEMRVAGLRTKVLSVASHRPDRIVEIALQLPPETPEGCFVPVYGRVPDSASSNTVTIAVKRLGGPCSRSRDDLFAGWSGGKTAIFILSRTVRKDLDAAHDRIEDQLSAGFFDVQVANVQASPFLMPPPEGSCSAYAAVFDSATPNTDSLSGLLLGSLGGDALDAGATIAIHTGRVQVSVPAVIGAPGLYRHILKYSRPRPSAPSLLSLDSGTFHVTGSGGAKVGPFAVQMAAPAPFTWANRDRLTALDRSKEVSVQWTGEARQGTVAIVATSADTESNVAGLTYCTASYASGQFTIPAGLLAPLPAGAGSLLLAFWPAQSPSAALPGIGRPVLLSIFVQSAEVRIL